VCVARYTENRRTIEFTVKTRLVRELAESNESWSKPSSRGRN